MWKNYVTIFGKEKFCSTYFIKWFFLFIKK